MNAKLAMLLGLVSLFPIQVQAQSAVTFDHKAGSLQINIDGKPLATYVMEDSTVLRPYFAAVHAPNGAQVTRNHPPVDGKDATDHSTMHPGLWLAFGDLGGADFWRNKATVKHIDFVEKPTATKDGGSFVVRNRYLVGDKTICEEVCRIKIRVRPSGYMIDWISEFTGPADFSFGDQEEMGLGVRVATPLAVNSGGQILNSNGLKNEKHVWGEPADWCDYSGEIDGQPVGITLLPNPKNFRRCWFHARDYGLLVANPFGQSAFRKGEQSKVVVRNGETFRLRFGILVHSGKVDLQTAHKEWLDALAWIEVSPDNKGFALTPSGQAFAPWGFNYDHDENGRLLEDYWKSEWPKVEADFAQMKKLGANVVRVHLQLGQFMDSPDKANESALDRLSKLVGLAQKEGLYLDLTGLGCYHKQDVPAWYDKNDEKGRWDVQARFWEAVAGRCAESPAIFCYDLMNEPVVPGGRREDGEWLGPAFAGKHFVQFITLDQRDRLRPDIARQWIQHLVAAIRKVDRRHLVTVGLVDWSLDRKGLTSGFVPEKVADDVDFLCVHIYPEAGELDEAMQTLKGFSVGKPVVVEETFPLKCSPQQLEEFIGRSEQDAAGWISFYWGKPAEELRRSSQIGDAILLEWLDLFARRAKKTAN